MCKASSVEIILTCAENLGLSLEAAECAAMNYTVSVDCERAAVICGPPRSGKAAFVEVVIYATNDSAAGGLTDRCC
jgi:GTP1/Obg family GTP-binding protein